MGKSRLRAGRPRAFSDNAFVPGRKKRGFCGLRLRNQRKSDRLLIRYPWYPYSKVESTLFCVVMNSRRAGLPSFVAAMPCRSACTTCAGSVTRSPPRPHLGTDEWLVRYADPAEHG